MANQTTPVIGANNKMQENIDSTKTFAAADSGVVQNIVTDGLTLNLPASASILDGYTLIIRNGGVAASSSVGAGTGSNGTVGIVITPASGDGVTGGGWTAAINKGVTAVKSTSQVGDQITLIATGANTADAWTVQEIIGTWARTA